jgi:MFS family permease
VYAAIAETRKFNQHSPTQVSRGWAEAFSDRRLMVYLLVNILFTIYISQLQSTMPLYFTNFVSGTTSGKGFSPPMISALFTWHVAFAALCQLPVARMLNRFSRPRALMMAMLLFGVGFVLVWVTGSVRSHALVWAIFALGILSIATVAYTPSGSALVVDIAPESRRGVYLSLNSQCWAIGYLIGPPLGGWALDQSRYMAQGFWLAAVASTSVGILILQLLHRMLRTHPRSL